MLCTGFDFLEIRSRRKIVDLAIECSIVASHRMGLTREHERKCISVVLVNGNLVRLAVLPGNVVAGVHRGIGRLRPW